MIGLNFRCLLFIAISTHFQVGVPIPVNHTDYICPASMISEVTDENMTTTDCGNTSCTYVKTADQEHLILKKAAPVEIFRNEYKPPEYLIKHVDLNFDLEYEVATVESTLHIYRAPGTSHGTDLELHGENLTLKSAALNGSSLTVDIGESCRPRKGSFIDHNRDCLVIDGDLLPIEASEIFTLNIIVQIEPEKNYRLMGLFKSGQILVTQCEAEGFRRITYFLDRPDVMSTYKVRLSGNKEIFPVLLSNGNKRESGDYPGSNGLRHFVVYEDPFPKPCYLFALVAGPLQALTEVYQHPNKSSGKKVTVNIWATEEHLPKLHWSMESAKKAMQWDEDTFGLEYDLEIFNVVCVRDFNMGAMENKSLNVFVADLILASPSTATDLDYLRILGVVGHEYFHNWTGDRVTLRDWFQLTLKEGLTVFRDQLFQAEMGGEAVKRIDEVIDIRSRQFKEDSGPLAHPIRPESYIAMDNFYTLTVYEKGAEVIRMYYTILGKDGFRRGMDLYFKRHDGQAVTCDDFRAAMADANNFDFTQFENWYLQAGTPVVTLTHATYNEAERTFKFALRQCIPTSGNCDNKKPLLHIPVSAGLIGLSSKTEIAATQLFHFTKGEQEFTFTNVTEKPFLSVFRNFSAPVKYIDPTESDDSLALQMGFDTDAVNRWDACQKLTKKILLERSFAIANGTMDVNNPSGLNPVVIKSFLAVLNQKDLDKSFKSCMLVLPTEETLANEMRPCDPIAIHIARESFRLQLRNAMLDDMKKLYDELTVETENKPYKVLPAEENVAPRRLRNLLFSYITMAHDKEMAAFAWKHFKNAKNMTDKIAAFRCLVDMKYDERKMAIDEFYKTADGDELVLDKWFSIQAGADIPEVLDNAKVLRQHELFTMKTPSRMRSVISRFAYNPAQFHRVDGAGYQFLADAVIELDDFNGPIASRTVTNLLNWKIYSKERGASIKKQLQRILDSKKLTPDLYEVVTKALL